MKRILFFAALVIAVLQLTAANVDLATAQQNAQRFLMSQTAKGRFMASSPTIKWTHEVKNSSNASLAACYIVNTDNGYVIVAGDDRAREILAYGDGQVEDLNNLPEAMQLFLKMYQKQMEYLQAHPGLKVQKALATRGFSVEPMLSTAWNQGKPYNMKTPRKGSGSDPYCKVGCSAVALAQVMKFWEYPITSPALPGYTCPTSGYVMEPLDEYTFDWDNMLDSYKTNTDQYSDAQLNAISWLMRYVGQAETMDYGLQQSGAEGDQILDAIRTFGYDDDARIVMKWDFDDGTVNYTEEGWAELIQSELLAGRPLVYCAYDMSSDSTAISGHAFNVDGYDADNDLYHVNFGMSADKNTYYALNAFTLDNGMTVYDFYPILFAGVQPPGLSTNPSIHVSPLELAMECYTGQTATATIAVTGSNLTGDISLALNDANDVYTIDATTVGVDDATNKTITVTYAPQTAGTHNATITLTSEGAVEKVVTLTGTATDEPLEVYDPVMLPADASKITATSFRADWTDQTPAENVLSYTLEVSEKPNYNILAEADWSGVGQNFNNMASSASQYMPEGWTFSGTGLWLEGGFISIGSGSSISTPTFELSGADKVTVVVYANNDGYTNSKFSVSTSLASQNITPASTTTQYVVVLDCAASDKVTFTGMSSYPGFVSIQIYEGEIDPPAAMRATEQGGETSRLITGITEKSYTINGLATEGTFLYKVKALYADGTESDWSNVEEVTLVASAVSPGDVNEDGEVTIADVTSLIDYLLGTDEINEAAGDLNGDNNVTIADVTALIDILLGV